jgi:methionyl-tRNA formyltransferase
MAGDRETGAMVMQMDEGLDTGPVLMAERMIIGEQTAGEVTARLAHLGADLMVRALGGLERGAITPTPQNEDGVTYAHKITKDEARIDWREDAQKIGNQVRGLSPWPGAWSEVQGERLKILRATPTEGKGQPGEVLDASGDLVVACGQGALKIQSVQRQAKAVMEARQMLLGFALAPGTIFV